MPLDPGRLWEIVDATKPLGHGLDASDLEVTDGNETRAPRVPDDGSPSEDFEGGFGGEHDFRPGIR